MKLSFGDHQHEFDRPWVMGIVNVTPDSFSDGGLCPTTETAVSHALTLVADGADVLDIGGESTRPGAAAVSAQEEMDRVLPVIEALRPQVTTPISIDTSKAAVARAACMAGATIVNDVTALEGDPDMGSVVAKFGAGLCLMHMKGSPKTMQRNVAYTDAAAEIEAYLQSAIDRATAQGIPHNAIVVDPGVGVAAAERVARAAWVAEIGGGVASATRVAQRIAGAARVADVRDHVASAHVRHASVRGQGQALDVAGAAGITSRGQVAGAQDLAVGANGSVLVHRGHDGGVLRGSAGAAPPPATSGVESTAVARHHGEAQSEGRESAKRGR